MIVEAVGHLQAARPLIASINEHIVFPLIALLSGIAFLYFMWGAFQFVSNADNELARETGKKHMIHGVIGLVVMVSAYSILAVATATFGISIPT